MYLELRGLHRQGIWRRECACFDHVPFGLLPPTVLELSEPPIMLEPVPLHTPVLTSWPEYFSARHLDPESALALVLHLPLTIYYLLYELGVVSAAAVRGTPTLRVDYLGPERELDMLSTLRC